MDLSRNRIKYELEKSVMQVILGNQQRKQWSVNMKKIGWETDDIDLQWMMSMTFLFDMTAK